MYLCDGMYWAQPTLPVQSRPLHPLPHTLLLGQSHFPHGHNVTSSRVTCWRCSRPCHRCAHTFVTDHLSAAAVRAAARNKGATAKARDTLNYGKNGRNSRGACRVGLLSNETLNLARPAAFTLLNETAVFAASSGIVSKRIVLRNAMRDQYTTLCRGIMREVFAMALLRVRLTGHPVVAGIPSQLMTSSPLRAGLSDSRHRLDREMAMVHRTGSRMPPPSRSAIPLLQSLPVLYPTVLETAPAPFLAPLRIISVFASLRKLLRSLDKISAKAILTWVITGAFNHADFKPRAS